MMEHLFGWTAPSVPAVPFTARPAMASTPTFNGPVEMTIPPTASAVVVSVAMRRGQPAGPATDADIEDFLYEALELLPGTTDVEVRCENGRVTLTGSVPHKGHKRDAGEITWAIPAVNDVQNNLTIAARRRGRTSPRETESHTGAPTRKAGAA